MIKMSVPSAILHLHDAFKIGVDPIHKELASSLEQLLEVANPLGDVSAYVLLDGFERLCGRNSGKKLSKLEMMRDHLRLILGVTDVDNKDEVTRPLLNPAASMHLWGRLISLLTAEATKPHTRGSLSWYVPVLSWSQGLGQLCHIALKGRLPTPPATEERSQP